MDVTWPLPTTITLFLLGLGYLSGSIPFGLVITRLAGKGDLRSLGSGNIGTTNVLRTGSKALAAATLVADVLKGAIPAAIGLAWGSEGGAATGLAAFLGHLFPVWLGFKGGKGVATYLGVALGLAWPLGLVFIAIWLAVAAVTRYSSAAGLSATALTAIGAVVFHDGWIAATFVLMGLVVILAHRANIARLMQGTESRISLGR